MGKTSVRTLGPDGVLTQTSRFELRYLPVPEQFAHHVTTFYHFRCDEPVIREVQPAAVGHLSLFARGSGKIYFRDGTSDPSHETNLLTPVSVAANFVVDGPFHAIGAALTPLGWAELTGLHAGEHANRLYPAADYLGEEIGALGARLCAAYRDGTMDAAGCAEELGRYIGTRLRPLSADYRQLIAQTGAWLGGDLNPDIDELFAASNYSRRQTQRLVDRFFGLPPTALRRMYRALRAAALFAQPDLTPEMEAMVRECFYDQPHLIREIRLFAGRTPARLSDDPDSYLNEMLDLRNLREIR
ncbi:helix-turn-helix domain-containing protein [Aurantiacibacter xanthus]|uniref:Helix-turn-helix domain-containing protein n=1 Tax=Aurantiacibacter xanthus TaxID=1784712 RepID=A0A3A1PGY5_9SPHN|nr:helix-turn-helix domain-containing protein [Aurantiacibacter xanthus]RIV92348.1 helix-turn-helix domain-containing protein [Aurantiacibacter xanthus]